jgi:fatty acid desaturase
MNTNEREIVRSLLEQLKPHFVLKPVIFYIDLIVTGLCAWVPLILLQIQSLPLIVKAILILVSYCGFYRGLLFIHEVVHFRKKMPGSRIMYNLIFGFPCRIPFFIHDPHRYHHLPNTFGTAQDPEYAYLKGSGFKTLFKPFLVGLLSPFLLIVRFGILPLVSWIFPTKWKVAIYQKASTIIVNPTYTRPLPTTEDLAMTQQEELGCAVFFLIEIALVKFHLIHEFVVVIWFLMMMIGAFVNVWRARVAHLYDNEGELMSPLAQLRDSVSVESQFWVIFWAPAGMQYHSLHHLAPQIPYYNLRSAHQALRKKLDANHPYSQTVVKGFWNSFKTFYKTVRST